MPEAAVRLAYGADPSILREIRERIEEVAQRMLSPSECEDLKVAVTEACANAVLHSGTHEVRVTITPLGPSCVEVLIEDDGLYREVPSPVDGDSKAHRGLILMAAMVDDLSLHRGTEGATGTQVRLRKCAS